MWKREKNVMKERSNVNQGENCNEKKKVMWEREKNVMKERG